MIENSKDKKHRNIYISNVAVEDAINQYENALNINYKTEVIPVDKSLFRTTCEAIFANISSPHYHNSAMDGIAVKASDTYGASEINPKYLMENEDFEYVNTGNPIPIDKDAVIMIEDVDEVEPNKLQIIKPAYPWQHIRPVGEDIIQGEMIIPSNHCIRPLDIGALISGGVEEVKVYIKPKVGILPTGNEIVQKIDELSFGKIIDSNSKVFEGLVIEQGGIPTIYPPSSDNKEVLRKTIKKGINENDILIINAGSSAGSKDFTVDIINELGNVIVHGVALKPGKPTILGIINNKPVIGIPGYPVSAYFSFETFVKPILEKYSHKKYRSNRIKSVLSQRVVSSFKHEELVRVTIGEVNGRKVATPLKRGAGTTMSLVRADGVLSIPRKSEGIEAGEEVEVRLIKPLEEVINKLVFIGSHDLILDIIADEMPISSGHVGSLGGIMSMRRGECHIAPIHLLDEETGNYNISYIKKYLPSNSMAIIKGLRRLQGIMVNKNNPKNIKDFNDLIRKDISFVNRQRGAGTRQLFDYELKKRQINPADIMGYKREMTTHMAVAVTIESGAADAGLGILSAAKALGLDFIPIGYEEYDFLVPSVFLDDMRVKEFIRILKSKFFKEKVEQIGGYELQNIGEVQFID